MAPHPMSDPGWPRAETGDPLSAPERASSPLNVASFESDFAELAAKFAAHGGESFPADLSAELALEIVLNEIVEQACLATGATGAAIVLERDGQMVCRASSGPTAPELGARLDVASGLSGECIRTGLTQRCDDAQFDPRADAVASQRLGVRSALVLPLAEHAGVVGLFEVFSPRAHAFGERDERTLEALAERVMRNLRRAAEPLEALIRSAVEAPPAADLAEADVPVEDALLENPAPVSEEEPLVALSAEEESSEVVSVAPGRRVDVAGWVLSAVVLACTVLLVVLTVQRLGMPRVGAARTITGRHAARRASTTTSGAATPGTASNGITTPEANRSTAKESFLPASPPPVTRHGSSAPPPGSLLVFENGKEVFRMPPSRGPSEQPSQAKVERASSVVPEQVVALSPEAAENSLIHRVEPDYPEEARDQQLQGPVVLDIHIGQDGTVQETKLVSGEPLLAQAAIVAVRQWRFQPRVVKGAPVEMETSVTLNFRLSN